MIGKCDNAFWYLILNHALALRLFPNCQHRHMCHQYGSTFAHCSGFEIIKSYPDWKSHGLLVYLLLSRIQLGTRTILVYKLLPVLFFSFMYSNCNPVIFYRSETSRNWIQKYSHFLLDDMTKELSKCQKNISIWKFLHLAHVIFDML